MFTVAILTTPEFDAASVDPSTVTVAGQPRSAATHAQDLPANHAPHPQLRRASSVNYADYQWQWRLEDVDHDGDIDMVMQFQFGYIELSCDAAVVTLTGQTKDGKAFEGQDQVRTYAVGLSPFQEAASFLEGITRVSA
jgi:hypothetical protein